LKNLFLEIFYKVVEEVKSYTTHSLPASGDDFWIFPSLKKFLDIAEILKNFLKK